MCSKQLIQFNKYSHIEKHEETQALNNMSTLMKSRQLLWGSISKLVSNQWYSYFIWISILYNRCSNYKIVNMLIDGAFVDTSSIHMNWYFICWLIELNSTIASSKFVTNKGIKIQWYKSNCNVTCIVFFSTEKSNWAGECIKDIYYF